MRKKWGPWIRNHIYGNKIVWLETIKYFSRTKISILFRSASNFHSRNLFFRWKYSLCQKKKRILRWKWKRSQNWKLHSSQIYSPLKEKKKFIASAIFLSVVTTGPTATNAISLLIRKLLPHAYKKDPDSVYLFLFYHYYWSSMIYKVDAHEFHNVRWNYQTPPLNWCLMLRCPPWIAKKFQTGYFHTSEIPGPEFIPTRRPGNFRNFTLWNVTFLVARWELIESRHCSCSYKCLIIYDLHHSDFIGSLTVIVPLWKFNKSHSWLMIRSFFLFSCSTYAGRHELLIRKFHKVTVTFSGYNETIMLHPHEFSYRRFQSDLIEGVPPATTLNSTISCSFCQASRLAASLVIVLLFSEYACWLQMKFIFTSYARVQNSFGN